MADPALVDCPANEWTKVATEVTSGQLYRKLTTPNVYLQTYRETGGDAPTTLAEGVPVFVDGDAAAISSSVGIDVYIYPVGAAGKIRVDL